MVRLEFKEGTSNKFWELALDDAKYKVRWGRIGTNGQEKLFSFPSSLKAKTEADKLIAEKKKKGYVEIAAEGKAKKAKPAKVVPTSRNPSLEKTIAKSPDDVDGYLVYADWLTANGDPRGELIAVQHELSKLDPTERKGPKGKALAKREGEILRKNDRFMGDIPTKLVQPTWRWGFFDSVKFKNDEDWMEDEVDVAGIVKKTFDLPVCAFLNHLRIGVMRWDYVGEDVTKIIKLGGQAPFAKTLRQLTIGDLKGDEVDTGMYNPDKLGDISQSFPNLEKLTIHGSEFTLGKKIELPKLRELAIETCGLGRGDLNALINAKLPKLEKLSLWFGSDDYGGNCKVKDLAPILDGSAFPKVKHLGLMNAEFADAIAKALPGSKLLKRLETLDLSMGTLYIDGVKAILDNKKAFAHLKTLNVNDNFLSKKDLVELKKIGPEIISKEQKDVDDSVEGEIYRYVSVSE